jgi:hypothetical protein
MDFFHIGDFMMNNNLDCDSKPSGKNCERSIMQISRRQFLKITGATVLSAASITFPSLSQDILSFPGSTGTSSDDIDAALSIINSSAISQEVVTEFKTFDIEIDISREAVRDSSRQNDLIGLNLQHRSSPSPRFGANLIFTVDLQNKEWVFAQIMMTWCLLDVVQIASVIFDASKSLYEELRSPRVIYNGPPRLLRPRLEQRWSDFRVDPPAPHPRDLVEVGWPIETSETRYWHYGGGSKTVWVPTKKNPIYLCNQVTELQSDESAQARSVDLIYTELP